MKERTGKGTERKRKRFGKALGRKGGKEMEKKRERDMESKGKGNKFKIVST